MTLPTLHNLIISNDFHGLSVALNDNTDPNQLDRLMGNSPLHIAAQRDNKEMIEELIHAGAFINLQTPKHGVTPLMVAVWHRKPQAVATLLKQDDINIEITSTFGLKAEQLIEFGASEDDEYGQQQSAQIQVLFDQYREQLEQKQQQMTAYNIAVDSALSDAEKAQALAEIDDWSQLNTTSSITCSGNDEHTAVMVAARDGLTQTLKVLMDHGGDQTVPDHYMKAIPLHKAAYNGRTDVIELLKNYSGFQETLNAQGPNNGYTPLHDAVWHGHTEAAKALIEAGARTDLTAYDGTTPLEIAQQYQYTDIIKLLTQ